VLAAVLKHSITSFREEYLGYGENYSEIVGIVEAFARETEYTLLAYQAFNKVKIRPEHRKS